MKPELKLALAKAFPEIVKYYECDFGTNFVGWVDIQRAVADREWLEVCWECEETLTPSEKSEYMIYFWDRQNNIFKNRFGIHHASDDQRATALIKVKGGDEKCHNARVMQPEQTTVLSTVDSNAPNEPHAQVGAEDLCECGHERTEHINKHGACKCFIITTSEFGGNSCACPCRRFQPRKEKGVRG
jgi:hypothetical protein